MKFLVTGTLREKSGPRLLTALTLGFFVAFVLVHFLREYFATGLTPDTVRQNLHGVRSGETGVLQSPRSPLILLEDLHVDLLLYSMVFVFLGTLLAQSRFGPLVRRYAVPALFGTILAYVLLRLMTAFLPALAYGVGPVSVFLHAGLLGLIALSLYDLYAPLPRRRSRSGADREPARVKRNRSSADDAGGAHRA